MITNCAFARGHEKGRRVLLYGSGRAGLWALLAAPAADAIVADCDALDLTTDAALMERGLFVPGIRKFGAFESAATLAAPHPLLLHNTGQKFSTAWLRDTYAALKAQKSFTAESSKWADDSLVNWLDNLKGR